MPKQSLTGVLYTDGGARSNPGPAGIGFDLELSDGLHYSAGAYIGEASNNVAEYQAIIWGLQNALDAEVSTITLRADSQLAVKQIKGEYKVKNEGLKPLHAKVATLLKKFERVRVEHVYREENKEADARVNEAIDARMTVGSYLVGPEDGPAGTLFDFVNGG